MYILNYIYRIMKYMELIITSFRLFDIWQSTAGPNLYLKFLMFVEKEVEINNYFGYLLWKKIRKFVKTFC